MRVFLDTNVLVSAFGTRGLCADVLREVLTRHQLVVGEVVLDELEGALNKAFALPDRVVDRIVELLREQEVFARPQAPSELAVRDPDDRWVLASALSARADVLVTGDADLLAVAYRSPIRIVSPRGFWHLVRGEPTAGGAAPTD